VKKKKEKRGEDVGPSLRYGSPKCMFILEPRAIGTAPFTSGKAKRGEEKKEKKGRKIAARAEGGSGTSRPSAFAGRGSSAA